MPILAKLLMGLLVIGASVACVSRGALNAPRRLMLTKCSATWETIDTQTTEWGHHNCSSDVDELLVAHESGFLPLSFGLRVIGRLPDGSTRPIEGVIVWLREPFVDRVVRITLGARRSVSTFENPDTDELAQIELPHDEDGFTEIALSLKTSGYPTCDHGHVIKSIATYPQAMLVTAPGCHDVAERIDSRWKGKRIIELRCGAASPNRMQRTALRAAADADR